MNEIEIGATLEKLKTEPRWMMHKGKDTEFYVTKYNIVNGTVTMTTTIDKHTVATKNMGAFLALWRTEPNKKEVAQSPRPIEANKQKTGGVNQPLSGRAAKFPHITSDIKVYVTQDYSIFKHATGNRMLNKNKIKKIVFDIKNGLNRLPDYPILVDSDMRVLDGQHRLECAIQTAEYIYYIIAQPMKMHEVARVNSNTERWKGADFINCYTSQGNEHYKALGDFVEKYKFPLTVSIKLLEGNTATGGGAEAIQRFEKGTFVTKEKYLIEAKAIAEIVHKFSAFPANTSGNFIAAIQAIKSRGLADFSHLLEKFKKRPDMLKHPSNKKQYITDLELIYNLNAQKRTIIF